MAELKKVLIGEVEVTLDPKGILESIAALDKMDAGVMQKMAAGLGLPTDPFEKRLVKPVLQGAVQNEWYKAYGEGKVVPAKVVTGQDGRIARYKQQLVELASSDGTDLVTSRKARSAESKPRDAKLYRLVEKTKDVWSKFKGQKYLIIKAMTELGAMPGGKGATVKAISETVKETPETIAPSLKNCAFHVNAFGHESIVEAVDAGGLPLKEDKADAPKAKAEPAKPATPKKK